MPKQKYLTAVLIDVENRKYKAVTIEDSLDAFYKALNCSCIDIVNRRIGGKRYDIICDGEALLKVDPIRSAFDVSCSWPKPDLYGNLLVVGQADSEGELTSLSREDAVWIQRHVTDALTPVGHIGPYLKLTY